MRRIQLFWLGLALVLGCLLFGGIATLTGTQATAATAQATIASTMPSRGPLGIPAIRPSLLGSASTPSAARFTTANVQTYLATHPFFGGKVASGATASVVTIQFMTSKQASVLMHDADTGLATTALVCYVKLHGPFTQDALPIAPGAKQLPTVDYGVEIFDGQTGNMLMVWTPSA